MQFSPDGKFLAVCSFKDIKIYETPSLTKNIEPLVLYKKFHGGHNDNIKTLTWSPDSRFWIFITRFLFYFRFILSTANDNTVRMSSVFHLHDYVPLCFTGHKSPVIKAYFSDDMNYVITKKEFGPIFKIGLYSK